MKVRRGAQVRAGGVSGAKVEGGKTADRQPGVAGMDLAQADLAGLMARLVKGIREAPEDGEGRVVALRQSIAAGSYRIPASAVAEKLTAAMLVEGERLRSDEQVDDRTRVSGGLWESRPGVAHS